MGSGSCALLFLDLALSIQASDQLEAVPDRQDYAGQDQQLCKGGEPEHGVLLVWQVVTGQERQAVARP